MNDWMPTENRLRCEVFRCEMMGALFADVRGRSPWGRSPVFENPPPFRARRQTSLYPNSCIGIRGGRRLALVSVGRRDRVEFLSSGRSAPASW